MALKFKTLWRISEPLMTGSNDQKISFPAGLVTSAHFRSPPVRSHDGRCGSLLVAAPFLPSWLSVAPVEPGSSARRLVCQAGGGGS